MVSWRPIIMMSTMFILGILAVSHSPLLFVYLFSGTLWIRMDSNICLWFIPLWAFTERYQRGLFSCFFRYSFRWSSNVSCPLFVQCIRNTVPVWTGHFVDSFLLLSFHCFHDFSPFLNRFLQLFFTRSSQRRKWKEERKALYSTQRDTPDHISKSLLRGVRNGALV